MFFLVAVLCCDYCGLCEDQRSDVFSPMGKGEQEALYSVIEGFVGSWWNGSGLYPDPCGWTPIQGVSCDFFDGFWYITGLNIGPVLENSLECSDDANFTPFLFNLKHLKTLSIYECFTSDHTISLPPLDWKNLASSLETLELRSNPGLTGQIPPAFGQLTNLQSLVLVENSLSGEIPKDLGNLVHLKRLSLEGNKFSGHIPPSLGYNLSDLLILDFSRNSLTGPIPSSLGSLKSLLKLDLSNNLLHGNIPKELGSLKNLTLLDLRSNNLSGGLAQSLQEMASLQDLLLSNNPIGGNLEEFKFDHLINLTSLDFSTMSLDGVIPESIAKLSKLRFLALDNNHLYGSVPQELEALPSLNALHLNANNLTGELEFSEEFYQRMGRRFTSWDNPSLCYRARVASGRNAPFGVNECRSQKKDYGLNSNNKMREENPDDDSGFIASFGFSDSSISGFWGVVLLQELLVVFLFVLFL